MNADYGMTTKVWGPPTWFALHMITFGFPSEPLKYDRENGLMPGTTQNRYKRFFETVGSVLPCNACRHSYEEYLKKLPIDTTNREKLVRWLFNIHNMVNRKLGIDEHEDIDCVNNFYEQYRAKSADDDGSRFFNLPKIPMKSCITVYPDLKRMKKLFFWILLIIFLVALVLITIRILESNREPPKVFFGGKLKV